MKKPKNLISYKELKKGIENYKKDIPSNNSNQTQSLWLSLDELKEYIAFVEENAKMKDISISGIRFHLTSDSGNNGKINMAVCPTFEHINEDNEPKQISFEPLYSEKGIPKSLTSLLTDDIPDAEESSILNSFLPCPPSC
jgi:hypothetical protein